MRFEFGIIMALLGQNPPADSAGFDKLFTEVRLFSRTFDNLSIIDDIQPNVVKAIGIDPKTNPYKSVFLKKLETDLKILAGLSVERRRQFNRDVNILKQGFRELRFGDLNSELFKQVQLSSTSIISHFGEGSFIDLLVSPWPHCLRLDIAPQSDHGHLLEAELSRFKKTEWGKTPFIDIFYTLQCKNYIHTHDYNALIEKASELKKLRSQYSNEEGPMISDCVRYNIQGLSGLKKDAECLAYFAKFSDLATAH